MRNIYRKIALVALMLFASFLAPVYATVAYPGVVQVRQADGSMIEMRIVGDEFFNYKTTTDGYTIAQGSDGFYYYASYDINGVRLSPSRVSGGGASTMGAVGRVKGVNQGVYSALRQKNIARRAMSDNVESAYMGAAMPFQKVLVLLVEFADLKFVTPAPEQSFTNMLNQKGYSVNGATGSAKDYFTDNSMGKYSPTIDVFKVVTVPRSYEYYGSNTTTGDDSKPQQMVIDACNEAVKQGLRLSDYDTDGNGVLDNVFIYYAGHNEAEGGPDASIWPHRWSVPRGTSIGGVQVLDYACTSELKGAAGQTMAGIGTFCHEFGHVLNLCDLYDSNGMMNGSALTMGYLSIMDSGNYLNGGNTPPFYTAIEREMLGWMTATVIDKPGTFTIKTVDNNVAYRINTANEGEYFLLESRGDKGWDKYLEGVGMLVYHIDKSNNMVDGRKAVDTWKLSANCPNGSAKHQCADLVEASGVENPRNPRASLFFPGSKKVTSLSSFTKPAILPWSKNPLDANINSIERLTNGDVKIKLSFEPTGRVIGLVTDQQSKAVISGATVILRRDLQPGEETPENLQYINITNSAGWYDFPGAALGKYTIMVQAKGYQNNNATVVDVILGSTDRPIALTAGGNPNDVAAAVYQRMVRLDWASVLTRQADPSVKTRAAWRKVGQPQFEYSSSQPSDVKTAYMNNLQPATAYEVIIENAQGQPIVSQIVITSAKRTDYLAIDQSKAIYAQGEIFDLSIANISDETFQSVTWYLDDAALGANVNHITVQNNSQLKAEVRLKNGQTEWITRVFKF